MGLLTPSGTPIMQAASAAIRQRLAGRDPIAPEEFFRQCGLPSEQHEAGKLFLERLRRDLQLDPYRMRPNEPMAALFQIAREDIPIEVASAWDKLGFRTHVEPFAYELMWAFEKTSDKVKVEETWKALPEPPRSEDQWIDLFMKMTVGEFARFVVNTMK